MRNVILLAAIAAMFSSCSMRTNVVVFTPEYNQVVPVMDYYALDYDKFDTLIVSKTVNECSHYERYRIEGGYNGLVPVRVETIYGDSCLCIVEFYKAVHTNDIE